MKGEEGYILDFQKVKELLPTEARRISHYDYQDQKMRYAYLLPVCKASTAVVNYWKMSKGD